MILSCMQPYFFPYIGYFELIRQSDLFIAFDTAQYIRHGWVNRNRIKTGYITVPIKKHQDRKAIKDVEIAKGDWRQNIFNQLRAYRGSKSYNEITELIDECLYPLETGKDFKTIGELNIHILQRVCEYLGIKTPIVAYSKMSLKLGPVKCPGDWALRISEALGASEYINLPGGEKLFDKRKWRKIKLRFLETKPSLSIIDDLYENNHGRTTGII